MEPGWHAARLREQARCQRVGRGAPGRDTRDRVAQRPWHRDAGLIDTPAEFTAGCRAPTLLRVHGGPDGQHRHAVGFDHQLLAALFRGGDKDFNVSLVSGKQMYHASRVLGGPTRRLVYPGE